MAEHHPRPPGIFRVAFDLPQVSATWPPFSTERIWTRKVPGPYRLELLSIPFFVRDLSSGDIISAKPDHDRRELVFDSLMEHSGRSTIRIILRENGSDVRGMVLDLLRAQGCAWEFTNVDFHFAVDIPKSANYDTLRGALAELVEAGAIEVEEAFIAPDHRRNNF